MDRGSKSELLKTVEAQQEKIQKYESKLRDLITAYKSVIKEKEALEASVKALSEIRPSSGSTPRSSQPVPHRDEDGNAVDSAEQQSDQASQEAESNAQDEVVQLRERLSTLTTSLMTLTQEKSKLEANFLGDKKKLRNELEEKTEELEAERRRADEMIEQLNQDLQQWKNKLRSQQHEREKEHHDHAIMLRELQKLLGDEREAKEQLEHQVDDLKQDMVERRQTSDTNKDHSQKVIQDLLREQEVLKEHIRTDSEKALQPTAAFLQLQLELVDLKAQHDLVLQQERSRFSEFETMMNHKTLDTEQRASSLETKVSELSEVVGNYERLKFQDQQTIQKLKERISLLDMENTALAQATQRKTNPDQEFSYLEGSTDVQEILEKIVKLKELLNTANSRTEKPVDVDDLLHGALGAIDSDQLHTKCREDYSQLKEEFERYKLRAQSVLKSKSSKDPSPSVEVDGLKTQVLELKDRLFQLRTEFEEQNVVLRTKEDTFHNTVISLTDKHSAELASHAADHKQRLTEQELEIRRHRERTIALLAEKDREIDKMRVRLPEHLEAQYITSYRQMSQGSDPEEVGASSEEGAAVSELLARTSVHPGSPGETTLLHFAQEQARKEVDIQNLRKQKHGLEMAMRELQQTSSLKEQRYVEQIDVLKEEIRKYERNISRESANLEYLKNVVYHFMVSRDKMGKMGTLNAIALILQFSPREKDRVQKELDRSWWYYVNSQKGPHTQI